MVPDRDMTVPSGGEDVKPPLELTPADIAALPADGGENYNRLVFEASPYLLQHAANPVDWYPWGEAAFERARELDRPIFLSIGYATCHWCHVMEHESFEDAAVARLLNEAFVAVKVDREERPDLDHLYMAVTQGLTGSGGWPMTVVLTPDRRPFFAGTYFPRTTRHGRTGMLDLLPQLAVAWRQRRAEVEESAARIVSWLESGSRSDDKPGIGVVGPGSGPVGDAGAAESGEELFEETYRQLAARFDPAAGGFGAEPKFPTPHTLTFLLRYWSRTATPEALDMVERTLERMHAGGIHDHVGGGFHRYSTDRIWLVPHFEKMLYDQALIALAALDTFLATGNDLYADLARDIFTYVRRDLWAPEGGFYSAEDADSEGEEGRFYVWSAQEIEAVLGDGAGLFHDAYGIEERGNWREEATGLPTGSNILHLRRALAALAAERGRSEVEIATELAGARARLLAVRSERVRPLRDTKILTDWNGLMIAALARGGRVLGNGELTAAAARAAAFVRDNLRTPEGRLLKRWRGTAGLRAHLDDYAFMLFGLLELYASTFAVEYLQWALELAEETIALFHDPAGGGFFFAPVDADDLLVRRKESYDGALPSGNALAALALLRLGRLTGQTGFEEIAVRTIGAFSSELHSAPAGHTALLSALDEYLGPAHEIVIAGRPDGEDTQRFLTALDGRYLPRAVVLLRPADEEEPDIVRLAGYTGAQGAVQGRAAAYVCTRQTCRRPVTTVEDMLGLLETTPSGGEKE